MLRILLKGVREGLGRLLILVDFLSRPRPVERQPAAQQAVDAASRGLALYQFHACPFCLKVRRQMRRLALPIELRDAQNDPQRRAELAEGGGRIKVPCLRIEEAEGVRWLYESTDIIDYLNRRFDPGRPAPA